MNEQLLISHHPNEPEKTARSIFESLDYNIINLNPGKLSNNLISEEKEIDDRLYRQLSQILGNKIQPGTPDLFCYNLKESPTSIELENYFYVEVKGKNDSLRTSQIKFIANTEIETLLIHVSTDKYRIFNLDVSPYGINEVQS